MEWGQIVLRNSSRRQRSIISCSRSSSDWGEWNRRNGAQLSGLVGSTHWSRSWRGCYWLGRLRIHSLNGCSVMREGLENEKDIEFKYVLEGHGVLDRVELQADGGILWIEHNHIIEHFILKCGVNLIVEEYLVVLWPWVIVVGVYGIEHSNEVSSLAWMNTQGQKSRRIGVLPFAYGLEDGRREDTLWLHVCEIDGGIGARYTLDIFESTL